MVIIRRLPSMAISLTTTSLSFRYKPPYFFRTQISLPKTGTVSFCSTSQEFTDSIPQESSKRGPLKPALYLVGTPIGNLEDITLRALRVLKSADVILSEDTRHSGKLLRHYNINTPLLSYHKFNESQREQTVLRRLKGGEIVALISDAGTPGISDPGMELAKLCVDENILVIPIPGPSAVVSALSASGLATDEFTFVGFLPKHAGSRRERLMASANEARTQIFYVPPHKLCQFLEETSSLFSDSRRCVIAREMTKLHEEFWRGTLGEAKVAFSTHQPKGEITLLIEAKANCMIETPSESELEKELRDLISSGHSLSTRFDTSPVHICKALKKLKLGNVSSLDNSNSTNYSLDLMRLQFKRNEAVKMVAEGKSVRRKAVYALALRKFVKQVEAEDESN